MMALSFFITFLGGINSVIWSDLIQFLIYTIAALAVLYILWTSIPADTNEILDGLKITPEGQNKLKLL